MGTNNGKCLLDPERDCYGLIKAKELEDELNEFKRQNHDSHVRLFNGLASLESTTKVQAERYRQIDEKLDDIADSIAGVSGKVDGIEKNANDLKWLKGSLEKFEKKLGEVEGTANKAADLLDDVKDLGDDVDEIKSKPAKRWESMWGIVAGVVITAIVTLLLAKIGLTG